MRVRDLVYLLEVNGDPDDDIVFITKKGDENGEGEEGFLFIDDSMSDVWTEDNGFTYIKVAEGFKAGIQKRQPCKDCLDSKDKKHEHTRSLKIYKNPGKNPPKNEDKGK